MPDAAPEPNILISGFGRCGTSLVMQMLAAAGIPTSGEWPAYEISGALATRKLDWDLYRGVAVKVIDPHVNKPPSGRAYKVIWVQRDSTQQARSIVKFARWAGVPLMSGDDAVARRRLRKSLVRDRARAVGQLLRVAGGGNAQSIDFEALINAPHKSAVQILDFLRPGLSVGTRAQTALRMAAQVRFRTSDCLDFMLEESLSAAPAPATTS